MSTENKTPTKSIRKKAKVTPTKPRTPKTVKTAPTPEPIETARQVPHVDPTAIINEGIQLFEKTHSRLASQIEKTNQLITEIRVACEERGISIPELNAAIVDCNRLMTFKAKLDRYLREIKDENNSIEKKISIIGVMIELGDTIGNVGQN